MSWRRKGTTYYKSQRYDPNKSAHMYKCEECGEEMDSDSHAVITLASGNRVSVCNDCAEKIANNNFMSLKEKTPEEVVDDFSEL